MRIREKCLKILMHIKAIIICAFLLYSVFSHCQHVKLFLQITICLKIDGLSHVLFAKPTDFKCGRKHNASAEADEAFERAVHLVDGLQGDRDTGRHLQRRSQQNHCPR